MNKVIKRHCFNLNPSNNGGEALLLLTEYIDIGDGEININQSLELNSYSNSASINFNNFFTPEKLRFVANELESIETQLNLKKQNSR